MPSSRRVVVVAFPGVQSLDVLGPVEVLHTASLIAGGGYEIEVVSRGGGPVALSNGLELGAAELPSPSRRSDILLVAGGGGTRDALTDTALIGWLRSAAPRARRIASVCTGALLLAEAGLLDNRRATTHWLSCDLLARRYPSVRVERDPIFVRDGNVWTSAGVTAGIDLALALVEDDLGREIALEVARVLVVFLKRPGGQAQFSAGLTAQQAANAPLRELQAWIADNLDADLSVAALAARVPMSERSFQRAFRRETGATPAAYVEVLRIERARLLLEEAERPLEALARDVGFSGAEVLRRAFHRNLGVSPAAYRERFRVAA